jgi:hypothetical protein
VKELTKTPTKLRSLLQTLGISRKKIDELIDNPFTPIQDRYARRCEQYLKKAKGWMDEQHVESDPLCMNFPEDLRELMSIYSELNVADRKRLLEIAKVFNVNP